MKKKAKIEDEAKGGCGVKSDTGEEEMENEQDGMEDEEDEGAEKSLDLTADDLSKSIAKLTEFAAQDDVDSRKQALLQKAQVSNLTKSEQSELHEILGGGGSKQDTLSDAIQKSMEPSEDLQKALDVSDFLRETHEESVAVNKLLAETIEKSDKRQHEFNLLLAKSTAVIGSLLKSVDERLSAYETQPARAPKSRAIPLQKSFAGAPPAGDQMSKSEILGVMGDMIEKSCAAGQGGFVDGVNMIVESSKYEQFGNLSGSALALVKQQRSAR
jgi:hypothetical protein